MKRIFENTKIRYMIYFIIIIELTAFIYMNTFSKPFIFDSNKIITKYSIRNFKNFTNSIETWLNINNRTFAKLTFAFNYNIHKFQVTGYQLVNVIIHIINGILVFFLSKIIFRKIGLNSRKRELSAFFSALIFITHPIQTQAVTYIVQRMSSLAAMFYFITLILYFKIRDYTINQNYKKTIPFVFLSLISFCLGLMSKQTAATIPLSIILIELLFIRNRKGKICRKYVISLISVVLLGLIAIGVFKGLPRQTEEISRIEYLLTQSRVLVKYLQLELLPISQTLDYHFKISKSLSFIEILATVFLFVLVFIGLALRKKHKIVSFSIFWFFITLSIESSIFPIADVIVEHRLYLPMFGFAVMAVYLLHLFIKNRKILLIVLISYCLLLGTATFKRNFVWRNRITFWEDAVKKSPNIDRPNYNLANAYKQNHNLEKAIEYYIKTININPNYRESYNNLGSTFFLKKQYGKAEKFYKLGLEVDSTYSKILINLGKLKAVQNKYKEAIEYFSKGKNIKNSDQIQKFIKKCETYLNNKKK